jgi:putative ABC transport system permease protein
MSESRAWGHHLRTIARLRANVSVEQATQELTALGQAVLNELRPETYGREIGLVATSLQRDVTRGVRPALLASLGAVSLVLIIVCVNVTNLLLARGVQRRGEFALRTALGAGTRRLIRQLLTESLLLAAMGGVAGIAAAVAGVRLLLTLVPPGLPRTGAIQVDAAALLFGLTITTVIALAVGTLPGLQAGHSGPNGNLHVVASRIAGGHRRARGALVVAEVALALVLLVSSGLLLRSLHHLLAVRAGFDPSHLLTMQVQTSGQAFTDVRVTRRFFDQSLGAVRHVPGVISAALTNQLPLSGDLDEYGVRFEGSTAGYNTLRYAVSPQYVETMGIPLRSGRSLTELDDENAPPVVLISESLAKRRFPAGDAVGKRLSIGGLPGPLYTIVGVVADVKQVSLALTESDAVYAPMSQWPFPDAAMSLVVRARLDAAALAPAVREAVWSVDKDQPVVRVATMEGLVAASAAERRFALIVFEAFALAALVLAAAGLYGVVSGSVAERTREIGVRSALGATRGNILGLVLRRGLTLTGAGAVLGVLGAAAASRAIAAMLFGVSPLDLVTYAGVTMLLAAVAVIASGVPAIRAARVDPASALRAE